MSNAVMRITGQALLLAICQALEIDSSHIRRIVIDAEVGNMTVIHIEQFGDKRLLGFDWPGALDGIEIKRDDKT